jgi:hypothetical protein
MATVIYSISHEEMWNRCCRAAGFLFENPETAVRLQAGVFRASGWSPKKVMERVLHHLTLEEHSRASWILEVQEDYQVPEWRVWITRRPGGDYILEARRVF